MGSKTLLLKDMLASGEPLPASEWELRSILSEDCLSYFAWNSKTREGIIIDPKEEDWDSYLRLLIEAPGVLWLAVVDTHTHADHISAASKMAAHLKIPLIMHELSPSRRVDLRICKPTTIPAKAAPLRFVCTPGHTPDGVALIWGPFAFVGDTVLFGDVGRDDLPGGDAAAHFDSLQRLKTHVSPSTIILPGHDHKGGRASSWKTQLQMNSSLNQERDDFIREAEAFDSPPPKLFKKSLSENFK